jgi:hypothetical protein
LVEEFLFGIRHAELPKERDRPSELRFTVEADVMAKASKHNIGRMTLLLIVCLWIRLTEFNLLAHHCKRLKTTFWNFPENPRFCNLNCGVLDWKAGWYVHAGKCKRSQAIFALLIPPSTMLAINP